MTGAGGGLAWVLAVSTALATLSSVPGADCNENGVDDALDVERGTSEDCNRNGWPDECDLVRFAFALEPKHGSSDLGSPYVLSTASVGDRTAEFLVFQGDRLLFVRPLSDRRPVAYGAVALPIEPDPQPMAADLDGEQRADLVLPAASSHEIVVLLGVTTAGISEEVRYPVGGAVRRVVAADLDGDEAPELVVGIEAAGAGHASARVVFLRNDGRGRFTGPFFVAKAPSISVLWAEDFDGDRTFDLLVGGPEAQGLNDGFLTFYRNRGDGTFVHQADTRIEGAYPVAGDAGDWDGDKDADLLVVLENCRVDSCSRSVALLENPGGGLFAAPGVVTFDPSTTPDTAVLADLDHDGDLDMVSLETRPALQALTSRALVVSLNDGTGRFELEAVYDMERGGESLALGDVNGDRQPEVAVVSLLGLEIFWNGSGLSQDRDGDGIPDGCERDRFRRGDINQSSEVDMSDAISVLSVLFLGGASSHCEKAGDADDDGQLRVSDAVLILLHLFRGVPELPAPFGDCGLDPTEDSLLCFDSVCGFWPPEPAGQR